MEITRGREKQVTEGPSRLEKYSGFNQNAVNMVLTMNWIVHGSLISPTYMYMYMYINVYQ